ncbi:MAG TPA: RDD family protein [Candidatus Thermoplasmatota archaeon]|nr:RDD family protein [Candidatus Thermoplasmatota archaeon]
MSYTWERAVPITAGTRTRAIAFAIDAVAIFALAWIFTFVAASAGFLRIPDIDIVGQRSPAAGLLWIVSIFELPLLLIYFTLFEGLAARTPGKMLTGLRVARLDGKPLTLADAFLRNLLRILWVTPFGPAFVLLDAWSLRATELDQRMGDLAAGTVVIDGRE